MSARSARDEQGRVRIPADVERPDTLLAGLTARQLAIVGTVAVVLWVGYSATRHLVPAALYGAAAVPVGALGAFVALGRIEGVGAERWVRFAWRHHRAPSRLVPAPEGIGGAPGLVGAGRLAADPGPTPAPLRLGLVGVADDGVVDLGPDGVAILCRASAVSFGLRTPTEQEALVAGFARWLNALDHPAQLLVRAEPVDVRPVVSALLDAAPGLPHPALEASAREHAAFVAELARTRDLLRREVLVVLRQPAGTQPATRDDAASRLHRLAGDAAAALGAAGVTLVPLGGTDAAGVVARALDPAADRPATGLLGTDAPVTRANAPVAPTRKELP